MSRLDRGVSSAVNDAIGRAMPLAVPWDTAGPLLSVTFASSGERLVRHQLGAVPDGVVIVNATGAVYVTRQGEWTDLVAYLTAPVANTVAVLLFVRLRSAPEVA